MNVFEKVKEKEKTERQTKIIPLYEMMKYPQKLENIVRNYTIRVYFNGELLWE